MTYDYNLVKTGKGGEWFAPVHVVWCLDLPARVCLYDHGYRKCAQGFLYKFIAFKPLDLAQK